MKIGDTADIEGAGMNQDIEITSALQLMALPEFGVVIERISLPDPRFQDMRGDYVNIPRMPRVLCHKVSNKSLIFADVAGQRWRPVLTDVGWMRMCL